MATVRTRGGGTWLDELGEWSWPGGAPQAAPLGPAAWVPSRPLIEKFLGIEHRVGLRVDGVHQTRQCARAGKARVDPPIERDDEHRR